MENNFMKPETQESKGSVIGGVIGALVGAAIGAVAWAVVGMLGYIASIIGFVIAFLADKGYDMLKGRQGAIKAVVLIVCVVLAVAAGTLGTYVWTIHNEYNSQLAELTDFEKKYYEIATEAEFMQEILSDGEVQGEMIKDAGLGLVFGIMGSIGLIKASSKKENKNVATTAEQPAVEAAPSNNEENTL